MSKRLDPYPHGVKSARKELRVALRSEAKRHGYRFVDDYVWRSKNGFVTKGLGMPLNDRMGAFMTSGVKPLEADDILWSILGFESNKEERTSLRVTGAFTAPVLSANGNLGRMEFQFESESDIPSIASEMLDFLECASKEVLFSFDQDPKCYFARLAQENDVPHNKALGAYAQGLYRCIGLIGLSEYREALELAERQIATGDDIFKFGVGPKGDATLVKEYCERRLAEEGE